MTPEERDGLIARSLEGRGDPKALDRLAQEDPEALLRAADLDASLRAHFAKESYGLPKGPRRRRWNASMVVAAVTLAAAGILIVLTVFLSGPNPAPPVPIVRTPETPPAPKPPPPAVEQPRRPAPKTGEGVPSKAAPAKRIGAPPAPVRRPVEVSKRPAIAEKKEPPAPPEKPEVTRPAVATLKSGEDVRSILEGDPVEAARAATMTFPDGTTVRMAAGTKIDRVGVEKGKRMFIAGGSVTADVVRQPRAEPMVFETPHGEATVLGTTLRIAVASGSRLEVEEGRVRFRRKADGKSVVVRSGMFAVAAEGAPLALQLLPKLLLSTEFTGPRTVGPNWTKIAGGNPTTFVGTMTVDLSPRPGDPYAVDGAWHEPGGVVSREVFHVPFELSMNVELSGKEPDLAAEVLFIPKGVEADRSEFVRVSRRGDFLYIDGAKTRTPSRSVRVKASWPRWERWVVRFLAGEVRVLVDGREVLRGGHGSRVAAYRLQLGALATKGAPQGARARFDALHVNRLTR